MQRIRAVQVVLGEGEPGNLRLILEAQGFDVVGHARGDDELRRVVAVTRPTVIVLDSGISALALLDAQIRSDYVPIVVVWPNETYTPAAAERVDPSIAFLELGNAVRRVADRHAAPIRIPDADEPIDRIATPRPPVSVEPARGTGRARRALVVVAAWAIALTALTAIGLAVPSVFRSLEPARTLHPLRDRPERALTADREGPGRPGLGVDDGDREPSCPRRGHVRIGPHPAPGDARGGSRGCALGHTEKGAQDTRGRGHGRPDDPGKGSGRGEERGGASKGNGPPDDAGGRGGGKGGHVKEKDPPPVGDGGGSHRGGGRRAGSTEGGGGGSPRAGKGSAKD